MPEDDFCINIVPDENKEKIVRWFSSFLKSHWYRSPFQNIPLQEGMKWYDNLNEVSRILYARGDVYEVEYEGSVIGLFNLADREDYCYLSLVSLHPGFQGKGIGRRMVTHAVNLTAGMQKPRLELDTYAFNRAAVRLYKKCGFMWTPDTAIHMVNYLPLLHQAYPEEPLFLTDRWYGCYQREITWVPDQPCNGCLYEYCFQEGEKSRCFQVNTDNNSISVLDR
ncbi:MAG: GNAT family N-acetyltransferase [Bacillota bacterium]